MTDAILTDDELTAVARFLNRHGLAGVVRALTDLGHRIELVERRDGFLVIRIWWLRYVIATHDHGRDPHHG